MKAQELDMIPYDLDPSLHCGEPERDFLDDGFSPPGVAHGKSPERHDSVQASLRERDLVESGLWKKSEF